MDELFEDVPQRERAPPEPPRAPLTAEDVREKMLAIVAVLREARTMPFEPQELRSHKAMFPIMAQWLSIAEGSELVEVFEAELLRLEPHSGTASASHSAMAA